MVNAPYEMTSATFAVRKSVSLSTRFAFLYPFSLNTRLGLLFALVFLPLLVLILTKKKNTSYLDISMKMLGCLFRQNIQMPLKSVKVKLLISFWLCFTLVISTGYSGVFFSFMVNPLQKPPVKTFEDISAGIKAVIHKCYVYLSRFVEYAIRNSTQGCMQGLLKIVEENDFYVKENSFNCDKAINEGHIIVRDLLFLDRMFALNSEVFVSDDGIGEVLLTSYFFRPEFCLREKINALLLRAWGAGLYQKIMKDGKRKHNRISPDSLKPLSLYDISGVLFVLIGGLIISLLVFFLEVVVYNIGSVRKFVQLFSYESRRRKGCC